MIQPLGVRQVHPPISNRQIISHINVEMVNLCKAINDNLAHVYLIDISYSFLKQQFTYMIFIYLQSKTFYLLT